MKSRYQSGWQTGLTRTWCADPGKAPVEKAPIDFARQPYQRMAQLNDLLQRWPQEILLTIVPWSRHRVPQR